MILLAFSKLKLYNFIYIGRERLTRNSVLNINPSSNHVMHKITLGGITENML